MHLSSNPNVLPDTQDHNTGSPSLTINNDQITCNMSDPAMKSQSLCAGADEQYNKPRNNSDPIHTTFIHIML